MGTPVALSIDDLPVRTGSGYPAPHDAPCQARSRRRLAMRSG